MSEERTPEAETPEAKSVESTEASETSSDSESRRDFYRSSEAKEHFFHDHVLEDDRVDDSGILDQVAEALAQGPEVEAPSLAFSEALDQPLAAPPKDWTELLGEGEEANDDRGLGLLVQLIKTGSVDPWDVDLQVVADRFMQAIDALTVHDLPKSGRLVFFASVILRLKAQFLAGRGQELLVPEEGMEGEDWDDGGLDDWDLDPEWLETHRRGPGEVLVQAKRVVRKRRRITIQDLLDALRASEAHEKKMEEKRKLQGQNRVVVPFKGVKNAMETMHRDDLQLDIQAANDLVTQAFQTAEVLPFSEVVKIMDPVSGYLAVLFLAARGSLDLEQEEFYGEVALHRPPEGRSPVVLEARERFVPKKKSKQKKAEVDAEAPEIVASDSAASDAAPTDLKISPEQE